MQDNKFSKQSIPYAPRNKWKAKVTREGDIITKDFSHAPFVPRLYGRICVRWETSALARLEELEGIPDFIDMPSPYCFRMKAVPGIPISKLNKGALSESFMERLKTLFAKMHSKGVAHGDAHMRNILIHDDKPYLVDFSTAYVRGRIPLMDSYVFKCFVLLDLERLYKVEKKFFGRGEPPRMFFLYRLFKGV